MSRPPTQSSCTLPVAIAIWLAGGPWRKLPALALSVALLSLGIWSWMLDADCEWYALPSLSVLVW